MTKRGVVMRESTQTWETVPVKGDKTQLLQKEKARLVYTAITSMDKDREGKYVKWQTKLKKLVRTMKFDRQE